MLAASQRSDSNRLSGVELAAMSEADATRKGASVIRTTGFPTRIQTRSSAGLPRAPLLGSLRDCWRARGDRLLGEEPLKVELDVPVDPVVEIAVVVRRVDVL